MTNDPRHREDVALARACEEGSAEAWERFVREYRPILYAAARALARDEVRAREIADSLWADLYGLAEREGKRRSLLAYFHGRSSLATWLRAVVAQRHVDALRAGRRTVPLDDDRRDEPVDPRPALDGLDPDRARYVKLLNDVLLAVVAALAPRDRLRLSCYYVQDMTLAEIGRMLGEHESTVSRKLERTRRSLRREVERRLRRERHLSEDEIRLCYDYAREEWPHDLERALSPGGG